MTFNLIQLICLLGAYQALQLCIVTLLLKVEDRRANELFAVAVGMIGLLLFMGIFRFGEVGLESYRYEVVHLWGTLAMLVSPLIYLYIRTSVGAFRFRHLTLIHFLPSFIHLCLLIPIWVLGPESRERMVQNYLELELYRSFVPGVRIGAMQAVAYWLGSFFWVRRFERHMAQTASFSDQLHLRWLKWLTHMLVVLLAMLALGRLVAFAHVEMVGIAAFTLFLTAVNVCAMAKPELFQGIAEPLRMGEGDRGEDGAEKYEGSSLSETRKTAIATRLDQWFRSEAPYLEDDLTLADVCGKLNVTRSHLSQVINQTLNKTFHDFVNDFRIDAAKGMLEDSEMDHLSVDAIAIEVGFRSRSVFFTAFKKRTQQTPAQWRKARAS